MVDTLTIDQIAELMHVTPAVARMHKLDEVDLLLFTWKARTGCRLTALGNYELKKQIRALVKRVEGKA